MKCEDDHGQRIYNDFKEAIMTYFKVDCNMPPSVYGEELFLDSALRINCTTLLQNVWSS
jgi:hypothetical protein